MPQSGGLTKIVPYTLQQLLVDQERDWVLDTLAPVLAWVPGAATGPSGRPFRFAVEHSAGCQSAKVGIELDWDEDALEAALPGVHAHARRLQAGRCAQREHVTELAAYGLALVALSTLLPGRRVKSMRKGLPPDILFDLTPNALRGVEAAGRRSGGRGALRHIRDGLPTSSGALGKAAQLRARTDIAEVHLSLWCASPRASIMEQIKP